ncbi:exported hypothetical protein [Candidatus Sulfotelmatobacter kueseliae]|uniref:Uncharacterized protein n=1 Tax=Candidatus Sulfotelmatobacter kueseliae TaxID=2042962 RepID=A0A2U3L695_9BACT|nr:exported hypothetical protein [Candidatus Sulfotelmatobacter kueseliae]
MAEIILGAIVIVVTALLAEEAPPKWRRWLWGLFVLLVIAQAVIQISGRREQDRLIQSGQETERELKSKLDTSLLNEQYTKGQLDTMNRILGSIASNSDPKQTAVLLQGLLSTKSTLKKETISICAELERWQKGWQIKNPFPNPADPQHATGKEIEAQNAYWQKFSNESFARFGPRLLAIIQRYGAIGVDVRMMEQQMTYGYVPPDVINKLRAFANRVNDDGSLKN